MPTIRITDPATEPVTLQEAKQHLRVDSDEDDALIGIYIAAAREMAEGELGRSLITSTWEMRANAFSAALRLDWPRVQAVEWVQYLDPEGVWRILHSDNYTLDATSDVSAARLVPAYGCAWPAARPEVGAVCVRYRAGYGDFPSDVPQAIRHWMLLHIGSMYENRESVARDMKPLAFIGRLLDPYRVY